MGLGTAKSLTVCIKSLQQNHTGYSHIDARSWVTTKQAQKIKFIPRIRRRPAVTATPIAAAGCSLALTNSSRKKKKQVSKMVICRVKSSLSIKL